MRSIVLALLFASSAISAVPYRFLIVVGSQWEDEASYRIERASEFQIMAGLFQSWGLPFEILRLDQQILDRYHLLDREGNPRYGTIVWDAPDVKDRNFKLLAELNRQGVSIVIVGDTVKTPAIAQLAGVRFVSDYKARDAASFDSAHFITRALTGREPELLANVSYSYQGLNVKPEATSVIGRRGSIPFLTVRQEPGKGRIVWIGLERTAAQFRNQLVRDLLKRSLVWCQGYAVYAEYSHAAILFADDWGTSDKTYLSYWHYRTPPEEEIRDGLIEPLKRHGAVMDLNVNTGFVDRKSGRIVKPWGQRVVDELDGKTIHDFASTKRGLDVGIHAGVFSVESHGWTHMLPDLESPPGPFWNAPMNGAGSLDWYNEFSDDLRKQEIPAVTQRFHLSRAIEYIHEDFGVMPHVLRGGGSLYSKSPVNNTAAIAAQMGFGIATGSWAVYLGRDHVISLEGVSTRKGWAYDQKLAGSDVPWTVDAPVWIGFHDRDLSLDPASPARLLDGLGAGVRYMSGAEYSAYLHTALSRSSADGLQFVAGFDDRYCDWFSTHSSHWTIHLSDDTRAKLAGHPPEKQTIDAPRGTGSHVLWTGKYNAETGNQTSR